jgi:hypothetical protein
VLIILRLSSASTANRLLQERASMIHFPFRVCVTMKAASVGVQTCAGGRCVAGEETGHHNLNAERAVCACQQLSVPRRDPAPAAAQARA